MIVQLWLSSRTYDMICMVAKIRSAGWWFGCHFLCSHILGISSSQLTFIFFRGVAQPPTRPVSDEDADLIVSSDISRQQGVWVWKGRPMSITFTSALLSSTNNNSNNNNNNNINININNNNNNNDNNINSYNKHKHRHNHNHNYNNDSDFFL